MHVLLQQVKILSNTTKPIYFIQNKGLQPQIAKELAQHYKTNLFLD
jgi:hypothetical protein